MAFGPIVVSPSSLAQPLCDRWVPKGSIPRGPAPMCECLASLCLHHVCSWDWPKHIPLAKNKASLVANPRVSVGLESIQECTIRMQESLEAIAGSGTLSPTDIREQARGTLMGCGGQAAVEERGQVKNVDHIPVTELINLSSVEPRGHLGGL